MVAEAIVANVVEDVRAQGATWSSALEELHAARASLEANRAAAQTPIQVALDTDIERVCSDGRWESEV